MTNRRWDAVPLDVETGFDDQPETEAGVGVLARQQEAENRAGFIAAVAVILDGKVFSTSRRVEFKEGPVKVTVTPRKGYSVEVHIRHDNISAKKLRGAWLVARSVGRHGECSASIEKATVPIYKIPSQKFTLHIIDG